MIKFILILICIQLSHGYSEGTPNSACTRMTPEHDVIPKKCQPKYFIQSDKFEYDVNDIIRITVRGSTNTDYFKGILLVVKDEYDQQIIGTWSSMDTSVKTISCDETENNAITHSSTKEKLQIEALWHAPSVISQRKVVVKATIVESHDEFYVDCFNITLTPKQSRALSISSIDKSVERSISTKANTNITWYYMNETVTVTMVSQEVNVGEWRAMGFSLDREMGNEYVFICKVSSSGNASVQRMHTIAGRPPLDSIRDINVISTVYENGVSTCTFSFQTNSEQADNEPQPLVIDVNYYLIFAQGILRQTGQVAKHNLTFVSSKSSQLQNSGTIDVDKANATSITTTTSPPIKDIQVDVVWTYAAGVTSVKMMAQNLKTSQWYAMGLSQDASMGEDHVFICRYLNNGSVSVQRYITPNGHSPPTPVSATANLGGDFAVTLEKVENGAVHCEFTLSNFINKRRQSRQNNIPQLSQTSDYRPLIAIGNLDSSNRLMRHAQNSRQALSKTVVLNRQEAMTFKVQSIESDSIGLMKAHGIIMIFTWIVLVSTGILIARYFKQALPHKKICDKAIWFAIHRAIMTSVAVLTLIAFVLILVYKKGTWVSRNSQPEFSHSIIGILVISFSIIQPIMALFRCNPDDRYRFIFNYAHATVGFCAFILSVVAIFLAMFFTQFQFRLKKEWAILVVWTCWLPIIFITFELIEIFFRNQSPSKEEKMSYYKSNLDGNSVAKVEMNQPTENIRKDRIKTFALLFHILLAFALALALVIIIGKS